MRGRRPPRLVERALERFLPHGLATDGTLGDLAEEYQRRSRRGRIRADAWYLAQALSLVAHRIVRGPRDRSRPGADLWMDFRWSLRMFTRHPGFALGVVGVLGLGLGANAAVFSVVDGTFRNAEWWSAPERTVTVSPDAPFSFGQMELYREDTEAYRTVGGFVETAFAVALPDGGSRSVNGVRITPALFGELAVQPARGRGLAPDDAWVGVEPVVVVGARLWHEAFGGDPSLVGSRIQLGGVPHTVVGIMGPGGQAPGGLAELWVPLVVDPRDDDYFRAQNLTVVGVLSDGAGLDDARDELATFNDGLTDMWPGFYPEGWSDGVERVAPANEVQRRMVATPLLLLLGGTGLLLLVTALNVGSLLLGRAIRRRREMAVRASIGAGRGRIVAQLLVEGAVLTVPAVALGLWMAGLGAPFIADLFVGEAIVGAAPARSPAVLAFVAAVGTGAWIVLSGIPIGSFLAHGTAGLRGNSLRGARVQRGLVSVQAGLATILLVSATLLTRTVDNLRSVPLGFEPGGLVAVELSPTEDRIADPAAARSFYDRIVEAVRDVPGVESAGVTGWLPLRRLAPATPLNPEVAPVEPAQALKVPMQRVDPGFFEAMGLTALEGRVLDEGDQTDGPSAVVINESLAALMWPEGNALGQRIAIDPHDWGNFLPVVGIVPDVRSGAIKEAAGPAIYTSLAEQPVRDLTVVARVAGDPGALALALRRAIEEADPVVPVRSITPMTEVVRSAYAISWIVMGLLVVLAVLATGLGAVGIYAVLAQHVAASRRDMGVRMALGAEPGAVVRDVVRSGLILAGAGVLVGCLGAALGTRLLRSMLFEVSALAPGAYLAPAVLLGLAALLAAWVPAVRAGRLAPAEVLRVE